MTTPYERLIRATQRIGERAFAPLVVPVPATIVEVEADSLGNAITAYASIGGEGRFAINALGRAIRPGQSVMAGVPVNNPSGELQFLGFLASDVAGTGLVRDAPGPPPDWATVWATTTISTSPSLVGSYLIAHFTGDNIIQHNPMSYIVSYQLTGETYWSDIEVPHMGGEQSVLIPRILPPGAIVNLHLRTRYAYAATPSEPGEDKSWVAQANTASPGTATSLSASVAIAGRMRLEAGGTIPDAANFYGWRYEIATTAGGAGLVTRTVNGPLDYEPPSAGDYYVAVAPVSISGVIGTRYPGPLSFDGPYAVTPAAAPLDTTAPPVWGAPTLATRTVQLPDGSPTVMLKVTFPAYAYPTDYDRTVVRVYDGTNYNFITVPYAGSPHDPIEFPVPYGTNTVDLKGYDKTGNSPVGYGASAGATVATPGVPSGAAAPSVSQVGLALKISWTVPAGAERIVLERSTDAAGANAVSWTLDGSFWIDLFTDQAVALTSYWYRIRGVNKAGDGAWSSRTSGTVQPLTGSFLVADSVTATQIAAGTITGNELNAAITLSSVIQTAASGTRWDIRGAGVGAPAGVIRFIENVSGTDRERIRLQGTGLTVYGDAGGSDIAMNRNAFGRGQLVAQAITIGHDGTRPIISIGIATSGGFLGQMRFAALHGTDIINEQSSVFAGQSATVFTRAGNTGDEPVIVFTGDYDTNKLGIFPDGIGSYKPAAGNTLSLRRDGNVLRWANIPTVGLKVGSVPGGYYASRMQQLFYGAVLPSTGGSTYQVHGFEYYATDSNMMTMWTGAYKGQTTADWSDCRFMFYSGVNNGAVTLGSLQLGARGYYPFWALGRGGTVDIYRDDANNRITTTRNMHVGGTLTKNAGAFVIDDPTPGYEGWELRHSWVEGPTAGTNLYIYRASFGPKGGAFSVTDSEGIAVEGATIKPLPDGTARWEVTIPLPDYWPHLNTLQAVMAHNSGDGWGRCKARVSEDLTTLTLLTEEGGEYTIDLRGTRKDPAALNWWGRRGVRKTKPQQWEANANTLERRAHKLEAREKIKRKEGVISYPLRGLGTRAQDLAMITQGNGNIGTHV